jgi:UDP:flavonoid glycosyltransferase YjiC (YdhE family)
VAKIALTWELGAGLGHLSNLQVLAEALVRLGHRVVFWVPDVVASAAWLRGYGPIYPFPRWRREIGFAPASYAEMMLATPFADAGALRAITESLVHSLRAEQPDVVVADHAPSALLAARLLGLPTANLGAGFFLPPVEAPLRIFRVWESVPTARVLASEASVLGNANTVLTELGGQPLERFADLLDTPTRLLTTWPELDHYGHRPAETYYGPTFVADRGIQPAWYQREEPRIFAYLKTETPGFERLIKSLSRVRATTLLYLQGVDAATASALSTARVKVVHEPVAAVAALEQCDLHISNGGHALTCAAMLVGKPTILVPLSAEQYILARRFEEAEWSLTYLTQAPKAQFEDLAQRLLGGRWNRQTLDAARAKYSGTSPTARSEALAMACVAVTF